MVLEWQAGKAGVTSGEAGMTAGGAGVVGGWVDGLKRARGSDHARFSRLPIGVHATHRHSSEGWNPSCLVRLEMIAQTKQNVRMRGTAQLVHIRLAPRQHGLQPSLE